VLREVHFSKMQTKQGRKGNGLKTCQIVSKCQLCFADERFKVYFCIRKPTEGVGRRLAQSPHRSRLDHGTSEMSAENLWNIPLCRCSYRVQVW
jgi:hypothetical protein